MSILTFGESIFRLSTNKGERLKSTSTLNFHLGGTELNIAANLASLGIESEWVSLLPDGLTGELVREKIQSMGVKSHAKVIPNGRPGWYLHEAGAAPRSDLVYHRSASSLAEVKSFDFDWERLLEGKKVFHTSGVTCGLSDALKSEIEKAMTMARKKNVLVSYDFNYRKNIWSIEDFCKKQKSLLPLIDILFCAESDLNLFFGKDMDIEDYSGVFANSSIKCLVINQRSADELSYAIKVVTEKHAHFSKGYKIQNLDRIGVGDSMAAGFLASYVEDQDMAKAAEWASAAGALKYGILGDMAHLNRREVEDLVRDGAKGIIR